MQKKKILPKQKNSGFTLIELLFAISIMAIIFSISYADLRGFQQRQHLDNAVKQIKADLRLAQEMALAGRKPTEPAGNPCTAADSVLVGYQFHRISDEQYEIGAICTEDDTVLVRVKGPETLPKNVNLLGFGPPHTILFNALGKGTDKDPSVCLRLQLEANEKYIIVTKTGDIVESTSCTYL